MNRKELEELIHNHELEEELRAKFNGQKIDHETYMRRKGILVKRWLYYWKHCKDKDKAAKLYHQYRMLLKMRN